MTLTSAIALFMAMAVLAALPSSSVALVVARSALFDVRNGLATSAGIVAGDLVFVALAALGMTTLASQLGGFFVIVKYAAAAYLIWFGFSLARSQISGSRENLPVFETQRTTGSLSGSFAAGLLLTMGDIKAIFFYASLLPAFLDLASLSATDFAIISIITIVAVGSVKAAYALAANRIAAHSGDLAYAKPAKIALGGLFMTAGCLLALKG